LAREGIRLRLSRSIEELQGSVLVTGFRGFGLVGYLVSWYTALSLGAERIGYILTGSNPPGIVVEQGEVRFPFELYLSEDPKVLIVVNRAIPDKQEWDSYAEFLAQLASRAKVRYAVLAGGLSNEFRPADDVSGYRWLANSVYLRENPRLEAPVMEEGLGVMGPLALLYMYMDYYDIPSIVVLPYSTVEEADYEAAIIGIKVLSELIGVTMDLSMLKEAAEAQRMVLKRINEMLEEEKRRTEDRGFYM